MVGVRDGPSKQNLDRLIYSLCVCGTPSGRALLATLPEPPDRRLGQLVTIPCAK